jgi:hypothetical protein
MTRAEIAALIVVVWAPCVASAQDVASEVAVVEAGARDGAITGGAQLTLHVQGAEEREPELPASTPLPDRAPEAYLLHGFRLGYMYTFDVDTPIDSRVPDAPSYAQQYDVRSPHSFLFGYEVAWRMVGHDWLNLLLIGNVSIAGVEQSRFFPSANLLFGFELVSSGLGDVQVGLGASFTPTKDEPVHMLIAAGFAPLIGSFYLPLHVFFVPDVDGHHRIGVTVGANFY